MLEGTRPLAAITARSRLAEAASAPPDSSLQRQLPLGVPGRFMRVEGANASRSCIWQIARLAGEVIESRTSASAGSLAGPA